MKKNTSISTKGKSCPFSYKGAPKIDYKNVKLLSRYITEKGKIMPSRITNVSSEKQKKLSKAIKRARYLGLLSYSEKRFRTRV
tara:strand:- start:366 stop:614 length:249 start_codon:yes stop_codon:yes gene_type:complete